ncbi:acetylcholinesterase-1-like [Dermacentor variabilis]|uniref:acetylcholinesterase-1-like n=1 Tax=Dermacentor variabilis TaxID=34621 RepID=UPI003F5AF09D
MAASKTASSYGHQTSRQPHTTNVVDPRSAITASPTEGSKSGLFSGATCGSSMRTGGGSPQEHSFWSAYSSIVLHLNSTCFVSAADVVCALATILVVGVLIVALVVLTDRGSHDPRKQKIGVVIRGPFGVLRGIVQPVTGQNFSYSFFGIPFAQPLSETKRFRPSQLQVVRKVLPSSTSDTNTPIFGRHVFNASYPRPACIQSMPLDVERAVSEDCLHLNIWTPYPNCTERNLPVCAHRTVLFFVHGDNFQEGGNNDRLLDGRYLAVMGDVVVVAPNYRLGVLGFLTDGTEDAPGNAGLYDQLTALQWVREYIGYFGGNGSDVVAVGHGAGAASIGLLLFSRNTSAKPPGAPIFDRVILMSNGPFGRYPDSTTYCRQLLLEEASRHVTCGNVSSPLTCLQNVANALDFGRPVRPQFFPTFGQLLPDLPIKMASTVKLIGLKVLIGHVDNERLRLNDIIQRQYLLTSETKGTPYLAEVLENIGINATSVTSMLDFYRQRYRTYGNIGRWRPYSLDILVDMLMVCPQRYFVDYLLSARGAGRGNRAYRYVISGADNVARVGSLVPLEMLFGKHFTRPANDSLKRLSKRLIQLWTDFAKNRHLPEIDKEIYDNYALTLSDVTYRNSTIEATGRLDLRKTYCDFLKPHYMYIRTALPNAPLDNYVL